MEFIQLYEVHGDGGERGIGPVIGYFRRKWDADNYAVGKGWYSGAGYVGTADAIEVDGKVYILKSKHPVDVDCLKARADEKLKADTLASLTEDQIRVLGLKRWS